MESKNTDIIVIGSGIGGLICAYILSKEGFNVLVLEKNPIIGGSLQTFKRNGVIFDTGMHYIGGMQEGQNMYKMFRYLGLLDKVKLKELNVDGFDRFWIGEDEYVYPSGYERFEQKMNEYFPDEKENIRRYISGINEYIDSIPLYNLKEIKNETNVFDFEMLNLNAWDYITSITKNEKLRQVLSASNYLFAGLKSKSTFYSYALIQNHYLQGAYRFVDGSDHVAKILKESIEANGGKILTNSKVVSFKFNNKNISAVVLKDGREFSASSFISNVHPQKMLSMVPDSKVRKAYKSRVMSLENTMGLFSVYIAFQKSSMPYQDANYHYFKSGDVWSIDNYHSKDWPESFALHFSTASDNPNYTPGATIFHYMDFAELKKWEHTSVEKRGEDYKQFKAEKAEKLIDLVENKIPGLKSKIKKYYTSTPLTWRDYTGTCEGSLYGIQKESAFPLKSYLFPKTKVPNLYFAGQNQNLHGMLGVSLSSVLTCGEFLDINYLIRKINNA